MSVFCLPGRVVADVFEGFECPANTACPSIVGSATRSVSSTSSLWSQSTNFLVESSGCSSHPTTAHTGLAMAKGSGATAILESVDLMVTGTVVVDLFYFSCGKQASLGQYSKDAGKTWVGIFADTPDSSVAQTWTYYGPYTFSTTSPGDTFRLRLGLQTSSWGYNGYYDDITITGVDVIQPAATSSTTGAAVSSNSVFEGFECPANTACPSIVGSATRSVSSTSSLWTQSTNFLVESSGCSSHPTAAHTGLAMAKGSDATAILESVDFMVTDAIVVVDLFYFSCGKQASLGQYSSDAGKTWVGIFADTPDSSVAQTWTYYGPYTISTTSPGDTFRLRLGLQTSSWGYNGYYDDITIVGVAPPPAALAPNPSSSTSSSVSFLYQWLARNWM